MWSGVQCLASLYDACAIRLQQAVVLAQCLWCLGPAASEVSVLPHHSSLQGPCLVACTAWQ
jgi:hypothetical protein